MIFRGCSMSDLEAGKPPLGSRMAAMRDEAAVHGFSLIARFFRFSG